jgi:hypothetical protein
MDNFCECFALDREQARSHTRPCSAADYGLDADPVWERGLPAMNDDAVQWEGAHHA